MAVLQGPVFSEDVHSEGKVAVVGTKEELQRRSVLIRSEMVLSACTKFSNNTKGENIS